MNEWEAQGGFPSKQLFKKLGSLGLLGVNKPVKHGGLGVWSRKRSGLDKKKRRRKKRKRAFAYV